MKKNMPILERFLAMVLILAMVLSVVPEGVFAQDSKQNDVTTLTAKLVRETVEVQPDTEEENGSEEDPSIPTEGTENSTKESTDFADPDVEASEPAAEVRPNPTYVYNYTLTILVNGKAQELTSENVSWYDEDGAPVEQTAGTVDVLEKMEQDTIYAVAVYDGITIPVKLTEGSEKTVTVAAAEQVFSGTVAVGAVFTLGHGLTNDQIRGLTHVRTYSEALVVSDGGFYAPQAGEYVIVDSWKSASGVTYAQKTYTVQAEKQHPAMATFSHNEGWYSEAQNVVVTVANTLNLISSEYLPAVTVGENAYSSWSIDENTGSFVQTVPVTQTATVTYADSSLQVKIDTVKPDAEILHTWKVKDGKLDGKFRVITGPSGLAKVTVNGTQINLENLQPVAQDNGNLVYVGDFRNVSSSGDKAEIIAVSVAGIPSDSSAMEPLRVTFTPVAERGLVDKNNNYLKDDKQVVTFQVENCDGLQVSAAAKDQAGADVSVEITPKTYSGRVSLANGLSELVVKVTDADNNEIASFSCPDTYKLDKDAPVVTVSRDKKPVNTKNGVEYFDGEVTYTFTVADEFFDYSAFEVVYALEGESESRAAAFNKEKGGFCVTVEDGQRLTSMTVTGADKTGNPVEKVVVDGNDFIWDEDTKYSCNVVVDAEAPVITAAISDNVETFYTNNDQAFAVLAQKEQNKLSSTVTLTFTVTDANLDAESLKAADWEKNDDGSWSRSFRATVSANKTGVLEYAFSVQDCANWMSTEGITVAVAAQDNGTALTLKYDEKNGTYHGKIQIDRRPPSGVSKGAPDVVLELPKGVTPGKAANGKELFSGSFGYEMSISDNSEDTFDSGLKRVDWDLEYKLWGDCNVGNAVTVNEAGSGSDGDYTINITVADEVEAEAMLTIATEDHAGNVFTYVKKFVVDTRAPRIMLTYDKVNDTRYYGAVRTATINIDDMNPDVTKDSMIVSSGSEPERQEDGSYEVKFENDGPCSIVVKAEDAAGHPVEESDSFIIDMTAPEIEVKLVPVDDETSIGELKNSVDGVDYFDDSVAVQVVISDVNLSYDEKSSVSAASLVYTTENGGASIDLAQWKDMCYEEDGKTYYTYKIPLVNGDVLTGISVNARDNANNNAKNVKVTDKNIEDKMEFSGTKNEETKDVVFSCTRKLVVDTKQPQVTVTKVVEENSYIQTFGGNAYYNSPVTYQLQVTDQFLDLTQNGELIQIEAVYRDGTEILPVQLEENTDEQQKKLSETDTYNYELTVEDGELLKGINILVKDNLGWAAAVPVVDVSSEVGNQTVEESTVKTTVTDEQGSKKEEPFKLTTAFAIEGNIWSYTGTPIIVDATRPKVGVSFSDNVQGFYTNGGTIYAQLKKPVDKSNHTSNAEESITVTFTASDKNLTLEENFYAVKSGSNTPDWQPDGKGIIVNTNSNVTLTASTDKIKVDERGYFVIDAHVIDLAGNAAENFNITQGDNINQVEVDTDGHFNRSFSLDRRTPTTAGDKQAPVIEITPSLTPVKTADGEDLFNNSFTYSLRVDDGEDNELNAGLKYVKWTVTDENSTAKNSADTIDKFDKRTEMSTSIPVTINGTGESNKVTIYIEAMDNVGNKITYNRVIGVDNLAPRVTVTGSNSDVRNGFYFKADQVITITIEDLNFDASRSTVNSPRVNVPGWTHIGGNKYQINLAYRTDGDYTFDMASMDLAGNPAQINIPAVLKKFTIDKTAPVIRVSYDPAVPVDTDAEGVQYFDKDRTVTVTIDEHNFNASDVRADLGSANALGIWSSRGDLHTASEVFNEGNNYRVTVNYVDLAGNPAQTYTSPSFSVDEGEPTITMTSGNLEMGRLNIVPDDLVLGFTINDAQNNLKNFSAEVIFLDRNYRERKVEGAEFYTVSGVGDRTTGYVSFSNISRIKENDGVYTIRLRAEDYAGHVVDLSPALTVSLNRFGSSFMVKDPYTDSFLTPGENGIVYRDAVSENLVITEINPTRVWQDAEHTAAGSVITVAVNGRTITLENGVHYALTETQKGNSNSMWYEYTYSIFPDVFMENGELIDGEYAIFFYSEDEAGNRNSNETNVDALLQMDANGSYSGKVSFVLDHQLPVVTILGVEENEASFDSNRLVEINIADNTPTVLEVYINEELIERVEVTDGMNVSSDWFYYDETTGSYYLNISGKKNPQNLKVVVTDAAGNKIEHEVNRLMLTDNLFAQYINSVPAIMTSVVLLIALVILILLLVKKRRKKSEQTAVKA